MADLGQAMEEWEWENIFASSLLEQDIVWHSVFGEPESTIPDPMGHPSTTYVPNEKLLQDSGNGTDGRSIVNGTNTSDGSLESSAYDHDTPVSSHLLNSETSFVNPPSGILSKKKKRDPRLECPNFLAGRIPCSCPEEEGLEEDVEEEALVKKKSKTARCQVPSCGGDINHLKGYHQRHRVCLECANSPKVMLKDQPHRYCQQCGKFHRLSDFDEGKRSCRRKLERHNRLRRRRTVEGDEGEESEDPLPGACNVESASPDITTTKAKIVAASKKQSGKAKTATTLKVEGNRQESVDPAMDNPHASDETRASQLMLEQQVISLDESKLDAEALLTMVTGSASEGAADSSTRITKQPPLSKAGSRKAARFSNSQRKCPVYVSPCPTGRISFKLYDWNPADFPRRLRQQIFEWLASMPVELESYVRSGCIILTFFISMTPTLWDKVWNDWSGCVLMYMQQSKAELQGTGQLLTQMKERSIYLKSGTLLGGKKIDVRVPFLVDLYPRSLEAGCRMLFYVSGFNLSGSRLIISFGGEYAECADWEPVEHHHFSHQAVWRSTGNLEVHKATVSLPSVQKYGVAYVEIPGWQVDSVHGVSNFMPVLVADKTVCSEVNAFDTGFNPLSAKHDTDAKHDKPAKALRYNHAMDIVADLGWALKYICKQQDMNNKAALRETSMTRLSWLLAFSLEHGCHSTAERLVQVALNMVNTPAGHSIDCSQSMQNVSKKAKGLIDFPVERGVPFLQQESPRAHARLSSAVISSNCDDNDIFIPLKDWTEMEAPLLEERIPILEDRSRQTNGSWAQPLGWARKPMGASGMSVLGIRNRRFYRVVIATVTIVSVCTGMCFMLQNPNGVAEISMSIRHRLWGFQHV